MWHLHYSTVWNRIDILFVAVLLYNHFALFTLKAGSQYDARACVASRVSEWCWNRLDFYSNVASRALASIQPIILSKNLTVRDAIWLVKKRIFPWRLWRQRHIVNQALVSGSSLCMWNVNEAFSPCTLVLNVHNEVMEKIQLCPDRHTNIFATIKTNIHLFQK